MNAAPRVWFRADASAEIGSGHVMRCLALALALRERAARVGLLSRGLPAVLAAAWQAVGANLLALPDGADDAQASHAALAAAGCDALVVDHYGLDARWERALRPACRVLLAIDDLADRPHEADLLLDANLGRRADDYAPWLPAACTRLIGPMHALLRPEFAAARARSQQRRSAATLGHLVISLGGGDPQQATVRVLRSLAAAPVPAGLRVSAVLGPLAPTRAAAREVAATLPMPCEVLTDVADMAALLASADLAVGAAGGSAWERCCLGVPTLLLVLADNQRAGAEALAAAGAARLLSDPAEVPAALQALRPPTALRALSQTAAALTDGRGAERVAAALLARLEAA
jgi:UDP-2,4-diacetamido-2,4,6-trideoxy-beta-L-altropyranose hydrolase